MEHPGGFETSCANILEDQVGLEPTSYNNRLKAGAVRRYGNWSIRSSRALALPFLTTFGSTRMLVWVEGFEPPIPCSQSRCLTRLGHTQIVKTCEVYCRPSGDTCPGRNRTDQVGDSNPASPSLRSLWRVASGLGGSTRNRTLVVPLSVACSTIEL